MMKKLTKVVNRLVRIPTPISIDLGIPSPVNIDNSPLNLINIWFNSADHQSALTPDNKSIIEKYLLNTPNKITALSRQVYEQIGSPKLYRGLHPKSDSDNEFDQYQIGEVLDQDLSSWTFDYYIAKRYYSKGGVILEYKPSINDVLLIDTVIHSNKYYLNKSEILLKSLSLKVVEKCTTEINGEDAIVLKVISVSNN